RGPATTSRATSPAGSPRRYCAPGAVSSQPSPRRGPTDRPKARLDGAVRTARARKDLVRRAWGRGAARPPARRPGGRAVLRAEPRAPGSEVSREEPRVHQAAVRSEEHTSELQSLTNLVCRLLLEKKKQHTLHDLSLWQSDELCMVGSVYQSTCELSGVSTDYQSAAMQCFPDATVFAPEADYRQTH